MKHIGTYTLTSIRSSKRKKVDCMMEGVDINDENDVVNVTMIAPQQSSSNTTATSGGSSSYLSDTQEMIIALLPILPAMLSITGSLLLIRLITRSKWKQQQQHSSLQPYQRLLFMMSIYDIFNSITIVLQSFLIPKLTSRRYWAIGNDTTCSILGFAFQFSYPSFIYFGMLSYYYLLTIRFNMKDKLFTTRVEPFMHCIALGHPTITAIYGLCKGIYGELQIGSGCWLQTSTPTCSEDCMERLEWYLGGLPFFIIFLSIVINTLVIFWYVKSTLQRSGRRSLSSPESQTKKIMAVANQSFLYVAVFFFTYCWTIVLRLMSNTSGDETGPQQEPKLFPIMVLRAIFLPMMGVGTVLVYARPRYLKLRARYTNYSRFWAFKRVLIDDALDGPTGRNNMPSPHHVPPRRRSTLTVPISAGSSSSNQRSFIFRSFGSLKGGTTQQSPRHQQQAAHATEEQQRVHLPPLAERLSSSGTGRTTENHDETDESGNTTSKEDLVTPSSSRKTNEKEEEEKLPDSNDSSDR